ncbi:MAG TPA: hypothetical protein VFU21_02845 [Kofleriaceae bacterium]|nr:hypothetical protein [Kofleriaceae bacterium]
MSVSRCVPLVAVLAAAFASGCGDEEVVFDIDDPWQEPGDWPGIGEGKIMVTNSGDDSLTFLDPATLEPSYTASTGRVPAEREGPHHGAALPDGSRYFVGISNYVPGSGSGPHGSHGTGSVRGYLLGYDTADNSLVSDVLVDRSPGDVRITPDGAFVLQSHFDLLSIVEAAQNGDDPRLLESPLAVVDSSTLELVAMIPLCPAGHGVGVAPDGSAAYVACWGSDELAVVPLGDSPSDDAEVTRVPVGPGGGDPTDPLYGPYAATVSPDGGEVWVSNLEGRSLSVYDVAAGAFDEERFVSLAGGALFGSFSADGSRLYVPVQAPDSLVTVDPATGTVVHNLSLSSSMCRAPHGTLLVADDVLALVCEGDHIGPGTVVRISLASPDAPVPEDSFEVGVFPDDLVPVGVGR